MRDLADINLEIAQMVVASDAERDLPNWFLLEVVRDLPRIVAKRDGSARG